jgi:hypothetical protein
MVLLLKQPVSAPAVEMAPCIRTATPGCPRAREEHAAHAVVSYVDCLSLIYSSLPMSILQEAEMMLKGCKSQGFAGESSIILWAIPLPDSSSGQTLALPETCTDFSRKALGFTPLRKKRRSRKVDKCGAVLELL